jgi:hypothetical protein
VVFTQKPDRVQFARFHKHNGGWGNPRSNGKVLVWMDAEPPPLPDLTTLTKAVFKET